MAGSKLIQRVRSKAFASLLRQDIAYFDRPENSSGAISARLSLGAAALQDLSSSRLGIICENIILAFSALLLGVILSWQLTLIAFIPCLAFALLVSLNIQASRMFVQRSNRIQEQMSAVRFNENIRSTSIV